MERSFSHLLRTSRLATYDKTIPQIYTSSTRPIAASQSGLIPKSIGDWGLKRNLPTVLRTHFVKIEQLDTAQHQTPFNSATSDYLFLQRWKENFPMSVRPGRQPEKIRKDLAELTDREFRQVLKAASMKRTQWKKDLENSKVRPDDHLDYLNLRNKFARHGAFKRSGGSAIANFEAGSSAEASTSADGSTNTSSSRIQVGPTYSHYIPPGQAQVQGRLLGKAHDTHLIGVCGVVAEMKSGYASNTHHRHPTNKALQQYYVVHARLDRNGRPDVALSASPVMQQPPTLSAFGTQRIPRSSSVAGSDSTGTAASSPTVPASSFATTSAKSEVLAVNQLLERRDKIKPVFGRK